MSMALELYLGTLDQVLGLVYVEIGLKLVSIWGALERSFGVGC